MSHAIFFAMSKGKSDVKKSEVLQGTLDLMILKTLHAIGPLHGFGIARRLEQLSEQVLQLNEGTVYTSLLRLQQEGWIAAAWGASENNRRAKFYSITKSALKQLAKETEDWERISGRDWPRAAAGEPEAMIRGLLKLWSRLRGTVRNEPRDLEFQTEIQEHVRLLTERYRGQGMTPEAAMLAARRQFGNTALLEEDRRNIQMFPAIESLRADLTYALRMLRKNRGFAATAVGTLALAIGANAAIFSVCNAVLFKPLPYAEPSRIVTLWERQRDGALGSVAPANFVDWRDASRSFSGMAAVRESSFAPNFIVGGQREASRLAGGQVSSTFFSVLGIPFMLGRSFLPEEDQPGQDRVAILSHAAWRERFGADRDIAGKAITLNDERYTVVGVLPAGFQFGSTAADFQASSQPDIWVPIALDPQRLQRGSHTLRVIARLAPDMTLTSHASIRPKNERQKRRFD
jgi:transcriptional regulator